MIRLFAVICASLQVTGCAILDNTPFAGTQKITGNIGENASILNDAHSRALNGVILQNILRARDRWPKHYTVLSGITSEPQVTLKLGGELAPIGLGNPPLPFGESKVTGAQDSVAALTYQSNPLERSDNAYLPIPHNIFARYWNDGWPRDVLLILLVKSISINDERYVNSIENEEHFSAYLHAVARLLDEGSCKVLLTANHLSEGGQANNADLEVCDQQIEVVVSGISGSRSLRSLSDAPCAQEIPHTDDKYSVFKEGCSIAYVERKRKRKKCPIVENYGRLHLMNNRDAGENGILNQIKTLKELYGGNVHVRLNLKDTQNEHDDVFEVRLCDSLEKNVGYEFVRLDNNKAAEFASLTNGKDFEDALRKVHDGSPSSVRTNFSRWTNVKIELRSVDDILQYLGEWLRTNETAVNRAPDAINSGEMVLKSMRCEARQTVGAGGNVKNAVMPLFTVYNKDLAEEVVDDLIGNHKKDYAVEIEHAGVTYLAVRRPNSNEDADCDLDRTSAVFALLSQLYIRSQSPEFLRAPEGGRVRVQ